MRYIYYISKSWNHWVFFVYFVNIFNCHLQLFKFSFLHFLFSFFLFLTLVKVFPPGGGGDTHPNQQLKSNSSAVNIRQCYSGIDHIISSFKKISCRTNVYHSSNFSSFCKYMYLYISTLFLVQSDGVLILTTLKAKQRLKFFPVKRQIEESQTEQLFK